MARPTRAGPLWQMAPTTMPLQLSRNWSPCWRHGANEQARKVSNPRPSVLEIAAPPLARAHEMHAHDGVRVESELPCERRCASYQRTSVLPVFPASRRSGVRSSSERPGWHGCAPKLDRAVPRSNMSAMYMRAIGIDSTYSVDCVNRLFARPPTAPYHPPRRTTDEAGSGRPAAFRPRGWRRCCLLRTGRPERSR
jgi:hypothetical protein